MLFYLAKDQAGYKEPQTELDSFLPELSYDRLTNSKLLDVVINETFRLQPEVPSGVQRMIPAEGIKIDETYIPGNTMVYLLMHPLFRDENFSNDFFWEYVQY
jgi:cytochrome P450